MEMVFGSEEKSNGCCAGWKEIRKMEVSAWAWRNGKMGLDFDGCWFRELRKMKWVAGQRCWRGLLVTVNEARRMRRLGEERMVVQGRR
ncbi:hypothetical protein MRB53_032868 [Persea americana]|uniref:Uncharacterized protein n=1 Tax=Persea americana TaxID=3435 RepID=A0ACC2KTN9_PERAE|nr:hypothetical protein MRB53_032868 [Persea americana]